MKYVIIGNSAAAVGAVEGIRRVDADGKILIISDETHHVYGRPLISYLLLGKTDRERMKYRPDDFYTKNGVETKLGVTVTKINPDAHTVETSDGETIAFEKLLVATGSNPFVPPMDGLDTVKNKFTFQTLDSALALEAAITPDSNVLIIGAGLIGLKCAEGIYLRVKSITFVDLAAKVLPSILDDDSAVIIKTRLEEVGIKFHLGDSVGKFTENTATLKESGTVIPFDVLVLAVGVRPNVGLVKDAGGAVGRAITVDNTCATSLADIYAAGDCTESRDAVTGDVKVMAILPNAYMQGETAGINMAGVKYTYDKLIPCNAIGFFGKHILSAGSYTGDVYYTNDGTNYKKLFYSDDRLNGFILIGDKHPKDGEIPAYDRAGIYTDIIRNGTKLSDIDFELIAKRPGLIGFTREIRQEYLGGER
ncbi:MAG: FAD-dependent oxidoreductase [Oscillospiraceae bacterium]|jgi:NADPH-dependent 2,4-dienoyl-CoA reductase/sulfur reductase-like enzyme|nr:FAD-dependent oxidoreductase [Oscillospiraceae bacterium]